ncbi:methyltransferase [Streptomyces yaizuensis]|uniref:Methyltransferase n=2 Tax=Streptomyces yaizuensis TaxID=2989713 RepID=A0ABQ5P2P2_9ACTN|nr:methyltransferase [Streptomyces sp. YSPA8]
MNDTEHPAPEAEAPAAPAPEASAVERVARLATLFTPWALRTAVTLRLFDLIEEGNHRPDELAARSGADPGALQRLLRYLADLDVLARTGDTYRLTPLGQVLTSRHPSRTARFLDQDDAWARTGDRAVPGLLHAVRTGGPAWERHHGLPFWASLDGDTALGEAFDRAMAVHADGFGPWLAGAWDWSSVTRVADIGGGTGTTLVTLLEHHPHLRGVLVDLPRTVERATREIAAAGPGVVSRAEMVGRSFFEPLPPGAGAYLLAHVLHDWPDRECVRVLRGCAGAAGGRGRVLVVDRIRADTGDAAAGPLAVGRRDLAMLVLLGGRERTEEEFRALGEAAGLRLTATTPAPEPGLHLIEFAPAD